MNPTLKISYYAYANVLKSQTWHPLVLSTLGKGYLTYVCQLSVDGLFLPPFW